MLVYVTTPQQFESAFLDWSTQNSSDDRRIIHVVFNEFMHSDEAQEFYTSTQLYSFTVSHWLVQFNRWRDHEIKRQPASLEKIRYWCLHLSDLMQSDWGVGHKLIVQECFEEDDLIEPQDPDLFDALF